MSILKFLSSFFPQAMNLLKLRQHHKKKITLYKDCNNLEKREAQGEKLCCKDINPCKENQKAEVIQLRMELWLQGIVIDLEVLCVRLPVGKVSGRKNTAGTHSGYMCIANAIAAHACFVMPFLPTFLYQTNRIFFFNSPLGTFNTFNAFCPTFYF